MRMSIDSRFGLRIVAGVAVGLTVMLGLATVLPAAQEKPASDTKKADEQPKQKSKPMREEQEESKTPAIKKPIKKVKDVVGDDEEVDVRHPKPAKLGVTRPEDLEVEAQNAKHQAIKDLF